MSKSKQIVSKPGIVEIPENDTSLMIWNVTPKCTKSCVIFQDCPYAHDSVRCDLIYNFIAKQEQNLMECLEENNVPDFKLPVLGIGLISLWKDWVACEIIKTSLGTDYMNARGQIHPAIKMQQETLKNIIKTLEFSYGQEKAKGLSDPRTITASYTDALRGD